MIAWKTEGTRLYQALPGQMHTSFREVVPLREPPASISGQSQSYESWKKNKERINDSMIGSLYSDLSAQTN